MVSTKGKVASVRKAKAAAKKKSPSKVKKKAPIKKTETLQQIIAAEISAETDGILSDSACERIAHAIEGLFPPQQMLTAEVPEGKFEFVLEARCVLTPEQIWPDNDKPKNPTVHDVIAKVHEYGGSLDHNQNWWTAWDEWNMLDLKGEYPKTSSVEFSVAPGGMSVADTKAKIKEKLEHT